MNIVPDKSWMDIGYRLDPRYISGVESFLEFALANTKRLTHGHIPCPCKKCRNTSILQRDVVYEHLMVNGILGDYRVWSRHGEIPLPSSSNIITSTERCDDGVQDMIHDAFIIGDEDDDEDVEDAFASAGEDEDAKNFYKLIEEAEKPLHSGPGPPSKLKFLVELYHIKCLHGWSNKSFSMLLTCLREAIPGGDESLSKSFYEVKKLIAALGLDYNKIDACSNDCMLYYKENAKKEECDICHTSRWKFIPQDEGSNTEKSKKVPMKILRHFPLIPRLQRLFMSSKVASSMTWHHNHRVKDGILRHPADSDSWKTLDKEYPNFSTDPRNVRLGLASDGFNPFGNMSISYSTWPVVLMPYNLPPWLCMKQPHFILSLLIPGPSAPGNNIDIYLEPLIDELLILWTDGVKTYDASTRSNFMMHAAILWSISDFPAYADLSGWSTKGKLACPCCNKDTLSRRLKHSKKEAFMFHRRFLAPHHPYRRNKKDFDNAHEMRERPKSLSGDEILQQFEGYENVTFGKSSKQTSKRKGQNVERNTLPYSWKKISIFFRLPYWKNLLIRHNLDVMHIEKNICDNILSTLLGIDKKSKDNLQARLDLVDMGIRNDLHPLKREGDPIYLPPASYSLTNKEKELFCQILRDIKVPDGYSSNISLSVQVKEKKIYGLKSHDCHVLMQQLLPIGLRKTMHPSVCSVLVQLCGFFKQLCAKELNIYDMENMENQIALILCQLERIFPPSFFTVMMHLPIHLATEARIAGPVQYRWMYPIERYLLTLKRYVRNRCRPEGSIAEGYIAEECLTFCSRYLNGIETRLTRDPRTATNMPLGKAKKYHAETFILQKAHRYVLFNLQMIEEYRQLHLADIQDKEPKISPWLLERKHHFEFINWLKEHVKQIRLEGIHHVSDDLAWLARGPSSEVTSYNGYSINGYRFHTKECECRRKTQNSGVMLRADTSSYSSSKDRNPVSEDVTYYGVLEEVVQLHYGPSFNVVLFKYFWFDESTASGCRQDKFGFKCINIKQNRHKEDPFILASQVEQCFYVPDGDDLDWHVVLKMPSRSISNIIQCDVNETLVNTDHNDSDEDFSWSRNDVEGTLVSIDVVNE